ncbi:TetR family transcriptional regulator [Nocardiopsis alba]|jgi:AcrR family transcriptional regulator|uniref:TetR family transcriptional regulator n=2 Tax=Nocardiopsis alba TaxID=53437 RepID=A0A7K2ISH1_9ACTN|nr:TetR family transcriptional regulator [Nocardiopsis alba]
MAVMNTENPRERGRPSLTERRKAMTQLEIARTAAELFTEQGVDGTTAEDIARASGVSPRTFYRYFRTKQEAVAPLLVTGADRWRERLGSFEPGGNPAEAVERSILAELTPESAEETEELERARGLVRAARDDVSLRAVWHRVNRESEVLLVPVLARLTGREEDDIVLRLAAAAVTDAVRLSIEDWAASDAPERGGEGPAARVARCLRALDTGLWGAPAVG